MKVSEFPDNLRKIILSSVDEINLEQEVTVAEISISFRVGEEIHIEGRASLHQDVPQHAEQKADGSRGAGERQPQHDPVDSPAAQVATWASGVGG